MGLTPRRPRSTGIHVRAVAFALSLLSASALVPARARAAEPDAPAPSGYSLAVESDEPGDVSFSVLAPQLESELASKVTTAETPARVAIVVRYRSADHLLTVRATHAGGRVVERSVTTTGDAEAIRKEAVLLAGNVARDEARELLDALAARQPKKESETVSEGPPAATAPVMPAGPPPDGKAAAVLALVYPIATNARKPHVRTGLALSFFYGHVGTVTALDLGFGIVHASRAVDGMQLGLAATVSEGPVRGTQNAVITNIGLAPIHGGQLSVGLNLAFEGMHGAQLTAGGNVVSGEIVGTQLAAGVNVAGSIRGMQGSVINVSGDVRGAQIGIVNIGHDVRGAQIGILNIANKVDGLALGLISITPDGVHPLAWSSNLAYTNLGLKFASKHVYTVTAMGSGTNEVKANGNLSFSVTIGGHVKLPGRFDTEIETAYSSTPTSSDATDTSSNHSLHQRGLVGYSFAPRVRLFAGGGLRIPLAFEVGSLAVRPEILAGIQF